MKINIIDSIQNFNYDTIVIPFFENMTYSDKRDTSFLDDFISAIPKEKFNGNEGAILNFPYIIDNKLKNIVLTGAGNIKNFSDNSVRKICGKLFDFLSEINSENIIFYPFSQNKEELATTVISLNLASYKFLKYKSDSKKETSINKIDIFSSLNIDTNEINSIVTAIFNARDLVNEPSNIMTPEKLAIVAKEYSEKYGFDISIYEEEAIKELNMNAFLAVSQASVNKPRLIVMKYHNNPSSKEILGLVGKGLTYDSGGLSIKPTDSMLTMKSDMAGAAAVLSTMCCISSQDLKINVTAVIAACENSISGNAYRPGDILTTMAGKTVEIMNTDAEGRLTLADAVTYAIKNEKVTKIIDIATLTGAALVALGTSITAVVSNSDSFYNLLETSAIKYGEPMWRLPAFPEYKDLIKSDIADLKNTGGKYAGTITAALFIQEFVNDLEWIHLDIAGSSWNDSKKSLAPKGGTGIGVMTLYNLCKNISK